jgi:hypothetical protein
MALSANKKGVKLNAPVALWFREDPSSNKYKQLTPQNGRQQDGKTIFVEIHPNILYKYSMPKRICVSVVPFSDDLKFRGFQGENESKSP